MTDDGSGTPSPDDPERDARLAALLTVDISRNGDAGAPTLVTPADPSDPVSKSPDTPVEPPPVKTTAPGVGRAAWAGLAVLLVFGVGLAYAGVRIVRTSTEGQVLAPIDDPEEPGYEAVVDSTPTLVLMHDREGTLDSLTVLTLPDPESGGGGVILVPDRTLVDLPMFGVAPIDVAYDLGDPMFAVEATGRLLGAAMQESLVVDADRWTDLVGPVAPISIDNPNEIVVDGEVRFEAGTIELSAEDVGPYLEASVEGEPVLARLFRQETFWNAWLEAVAADGTDAAVPGELDSGIARFVRTIAAGTHEVQTLPVDEVPSDDGSDVPVFEPQLDAAATLVDRLVPLPRSPFPGARARTRVLNGTTDTSRAASVAGDLPPAGVEITIIGNASSFGVETTTVEYAGDFREKAESVAEILGVGEVVEETRPSESVDITVTLGADYG